MQLAKIVLDGRMQLVCVPITLELNSQEFDHNGERIAVDAGITLRIKP